MEEPKEMRSAPNLVTQVAPVWLKTQITIKVKTQPRYDESQIFINLRNYPSDYIISEMTSGYPAKISPDPGFWDFPIPILISGISGPSGFFDIAQNKKISIPNPRDRNLGLKIPKKSRPEANSAYKFLYDWA